MFLNNHVGKSVGNKKYYYRRVFSISKSVSNNIFLLQTDLPTEKNYRRKIHRRNISVGDFVGILITDGICVLRWKKNFISKIVKSCSDISDDVLLGPFYYLNIQLAFISSITKLVLFKCKHVYILKILNSYKKIKKK